MVRKLFFTVVMAAFLLAIGPPVVGQSINSDNSDDRYDNDRQYYGSNAKIDRYLGAEVWVNHNDGEYYVGDDILIHFRTNADAFVTIYSIDSRGRVNLLFPTELGEDNYIRGGVTYNLPGADADFDLEVSGPEGFENIQIIASREQFPIPTWYHNSGLVCDWDDRADYMDYLNEEYFVRYNGQRFAYDRAVIYVNEWEPDYYRPVYIPDYPHWTPYGNVYIDYPLGGTVYINGVYWGVVPLYVPRICVGWHTITVYDPFGYCWENDFHVSRYNTVVFNKTIINPRPGVRSKYKEVREVGYRDPAKNGYPQYKRVADAGRLHKESGKITRGKTGTDGRTKTIQIATPGKKYVKGSTRLIRTSRGFETDASSGVYTGKGRTKRGATVRPRSSYEERSRTGHKSSYEGASSKRDRQSNGVTSRSGSSSEKSTGSSRGTSSDYYRKRTGGGKSASGSATVKGRSTTNRSDGSSKSTAGSSSKRSGSSSSSGTVQKRSGSSRSSSKQPAVQERKSSNTRSKSSSNSTSSRKAESRQKSSSNNVHRKSSSNSSQQKSSDRSSRSNSNSRKRR